MGKLAIKRLTGSDLTLFEWQFRNRNAGNQKSINLNADVFVDELYPSLLDTDVGRNGRIYLDLFLYGPGHAPVLNLQRKIIKGGTYKNWRLDGEYISNPDDDPTRFNALVPGDYAILDFEGDLYPTEARAVFVAGGVAEDGNLHRGIDDFGVGSMRAIDMAELRLIVHASGTSEDHPVYELLLDAAIEDAAHGGLEGTQRILQRGLGRRLTRSELERARQRADDIGRAGEELINAYLASQQITNLITAYEWVSAENAISPYDFTVQPAGAGNGKAEVKSTNGDFNQIMHLSIAQLIAMGDSVEPFEIYRVYALDEHSAKLRISTNAKTFAQRVLQQLAQLPPGVTVDGISVRPATISFGEEIIIELPSVGESFPT